MRYLATALLSILIASQGLQAAPKKKTKAAKDKAAAAAAAAAAPAAAAVEGEAAAAASEVAAAPAGHEGGTYGVAGCGLGSLMVSSKGKFAQVGASILNATGVQSSGITSGTSNCGETKAAVALREQKVFIATNLNSLSKEAAQGGGPYLNGLAEVLGCEGDAQSLRLGQVSQEKYYEIFAHEEPSQVLDQYHAAIQADPELAAHCITAS